MITRVWQPGAISYLRRHGMTESKAISNVLSGFDFDHPVYEQPLSRGDIYFQFVRTPSVHDHSANVGGWFCLRGQDLTRLAIYSPGAPRRVGEFEVVEDVVILEGIAKDFIVTPEMARENPDLAEYGIGGRGGGTQIYVPPVLRGALRMRGMYLGSDRFATPEF